jgi:hypothetical protein
VDPNYHGQRIHRQGRVIGTFTDRLAGRTALVRWVDGSEQLCPTSDLTRSPR